MQILIMALILAGCYFLWEKSQQAKKARDQLATKSSEPEKVKAEITPAEVQKAYQKKWMFTYNEKDAYKKLQEIAAPKGYTVFAKVRLFDLVEPIRQNPKYKTFLYKVQAKHVDFVICDQKLVAKYIIELDDNSHNQDERKERDQFIDTVLTSTGYKVLHTRAIEKEEIEKFLTD